ncbi:MAG: hypothetical protein COB81_06000, partial [Flavobacteriaceae bacterium]
ILPDITAQCEITNLTAPTATDNCGGTITATHDATLPITTQGTISILWTSDDENGNSITQTQNIIIKDTTDPVADLPVLADITAQCEIINLTAPTATDNCSGTITATHNATLPITTQGTTDIIWTFDDGNGNSITQTQNIIIKDTIAPEPDELFLSLITIPLNTETPKPTATDNCLEETTVSSSDPTIFSSPGSYLITWFYTDMFGNTTSQDQAILVLGNLLAKENNYITPNNDGVNDYLILKNIHKFPKNSVQVFTRTGKRVFKQLNAKDHWDGFGNIDYNERVPRGVYYYIIDYYLGHSTPVVGWVYVDY